MKHIATICILILMSCVQRQNNPEKKIDDLIMNVYLNSEPSFSGKKLLPYKPKDLLKIALTKEIKSLGLTANLHYIEPSCGGCWEYKLLDISDKENNHYVFPIMDAFFYNSYSGTINHSWTGEKLDTNVSYKEQQLTDQILENATFQNNLNHILSKDNSFNNFSLKNTSSVKKVKLLIDELLNNFILYPTYWDCQIEKERKSVSSCIEENRIQLEDTLIIYKHIQEKQNFDRQLSDSIVLSKRFKKQSSEVRRVIKNLKYYSDRYAYYWFYDAIYEFEINEQVDTKRPFVKVDLINKEWFMRMMF